MINNEKKISIIGLGNIGFRYLQSVLSISNINNILLIENQKSRIEFISDFIKKLDLKKIKNIEIKSYIDKSLIDSNLIIISTTSLNRLEVCEKLISLNFSCPLLLEKCIFPNLEKLIEGYSLLQAWDERIYVNQWLRLSYLGDLMKSFVERPLSIFLEGNTRLFSNAIHYIDLICSTFSIDDFEMDLDNSKCESIYQSKRAGFSEMYGILTFYSRKKDIRLTLIDNISKKDNTKRRKLTVKQNKQENIYFIDYFSNSVLDINNKKLGNMPLLSEHAIDTIKKITNKEIPSIPNLDQSMSHHKLILENLPSLVGKDDLESILIT